MARCVGRHYHGLVTQSGMTEHQAASGSAYVVIALDERQLTRPPRSGECTCLFCGLFRTHHYWVRAVFATAIVPGALWIAYAVNTYVSRQKVPGGGGIVGVLLLIATACAVLALGCWYQPVRRLVHLRKPRSTVWPPPPKAAVRSV
jgi:hypothetical protein